MKLKIAYNNEAKPGFKAGWGFSCLVGDKVLFDTGDNGPGLLHNLDKLGCDPKKIEIVVLSHQHWDHTGGLSDLLKLNNEIEVYVLKSFTEDFKTEIKAKIVDVEDTRQITDNIYTTGLIENNPDEQALILKTDNGVTVIVGCSHPGVDKILDAAKQYGDIYAVIGGFHGFSNLDALEGIEIIGACHCTQYMKEIKERFPKQFKEIKAGDIIEV